ncbi:MAG TPA: P-II family nitrogen regulator [Nitrososphaeraceae archaeon]|nr:P-II family nitrogen regulator [Nitrososphaeraceae archaeon]
MITAIYLVKIISYNDNSKRKIMSGLKRVEVFLKPTKVDSVIQSIKKMDFETTLYDSKGFGKEKQKVRAGRGAQVVKLGCSTRSTIVTIVDSSKLSELLDTIKKANKGYDNIGVIAISPMDALLHM